MAEVDIQRLFRFLLRHQKLDPEIAQSLLQQILIIFQELRTKHDEGKKNKTDESVGKDQ